mgnify:CR=1 FL=1
MALLCARQPGAGDNAAHDLAPPLRIIGTPPLAHQLLPQSLATLRRRLPDAPCSLLSAPTRDIVRSLLLRDRAQQPATRGRTPEADVREPERRAASAPVPDP